MVEYLLNPLFIYLFILMYLEFLLFILLKYLWNIFKLAVINIWNIPTAKNNYPLKFPSTPNLPQRLKPKAPSVFHQKLIYVICNIGMQIKALIIQYKLLEMAEATQQIQLQHTTNTHNFDQKLKHQQTELQLINLNQNLNLNLNQNQNTQQIKLLNPDTANIAINSTQPDHPTHHTHPDHPDHLFHSDNTNPRSTAIYRPDIDGLRAVAGGLVVIFNAWPERLTGGFVGVDVFFVISGYLITQILVKQNLRRNFSYYGFYNRRVKRIYPSLIAVLLFVLCLGIRYFDHQKLKMLTKTMAASTVFGANIEILTYKQGYFDADVKTNPLLHLWLLGVEEQFYIFWPFLITLILTRFNSRAFKLLSAFCVLCFLLNIITVYINAKFSFYFPFCRFWQMAIGGLLAFKAIKVSNLFFANALSVVGLIAIILASFFLSEGNLYPGWWALIPTLSTAAIIQAGTISVVNKHILGNKVMVFFGKISYSLYLWHWPLLVFSRILFPEGSTSILGKMWFVVLMSIVMSLLSYFLVENPIRFKKAKSIFIALLLVMFLIGVASIIVYKYSDRIKGEDKKQDRSEDSEAIAPSNQKEREQYQLDMIPTQQDCYEKNGKKIPNWSKSRNRTAVTPKKIKIALEKRPWLKLIFDKAIDQTSKYYRPTLPKNLANYQVANEGQQNLVLLVGDSHAHFTAFRFGKLYEQAKKTNTTQDLPTFVGILFSGTTLIPYEDNYEFVVGFIQEFRPDRVMFVYYWMSYRIYHGFEDFQRNKQNVDDEYFYENIGYFINIVQNCTKNNISVTTNTIHPHGTPYNPQTMYNQNTIIPQNTHPVPLRQISKTYIHLANHLVTEVKRVGGNVIDYTEHCCWEEMCEVVSPTGYNVYYDTNHWTYQLSRNWLTLVDFFIYFEEL